MVSPDFRGLLKLFKEEGSGFKKDPKMPKVLSPKQERFHYSVAMEIADQEFFGCDKRPSGMATAFHNPQYFRDRCLAIMGKIGKRINDVASGDEPLRALLLGDLESLRRQIRTVTKTENDLEIIAGLLGLVAHLLGWERLDRKFHRIPVYFQTNEQRKDSLNSLAGLFGSSGLFEAYHQRRLAIALHEEGLTDERISLVLSLSPKMVASLRQNSRIDEHYRRQYGTSEKASEPRS